MEHFPVVRSLCRSAMADPSPAVRRQVERLRDELMQSGETKQAASLTELLGPTERKGEAGPGSTLRPRANVPEKALTPFTPLPVDRETSAPLADLMFAEGFQLGPPLFDARTRDAVETTLEEWENLEELLSVGIKPPMLCLIHGQADPERRAWLTGLPGNSVCRSCRHGSMDSFPLPWERPRATSEPCSDSQTAFAASSNSTSSTQLPGFATIRRRWAS